MTVDAVGECAAKSDRFRCEINSADMYFRAPQNNSTTHGPRFPAIFRFSVAAANMALLGKLALNLLKRKTSRKVGIKIRRLEARWNNAYLLKVLTAGGGVMR